jgi:deoxyribose-phosphate aldolase
MNEPTSATGLKDLAKMIDHSLLHPTLTDDGLAAGCELARRYEVATVCVKPYATRQARQVLAGSGIGVCAVAAFPHGNSTTALKIEEAREAIRNGASEIDMVVNIGKVLSGDWQYVAEEIRSANNAVTESGALLKVIFENDYLEDEHIIALSEICSHAAVAFVKTSTGYGFVRQANGMYDYKGATDRHLRLMRQHCAETVQVKAAGGVRSLDDLLRVRGLGVSRVGATATESILDEARRRGFE